MFRPTLFISALAYSGLSFAGGPLVLGGPAGHTPVTYQNPNITLNVESGDLGTLSNTDANTLVTDALALWNNVSTSNIKLVIDKTQIPLDININNYEDYLPNVSGTVFHSSDNLNPVVYDSTGKIIDAFFGGDGGTGTQSDTVIGFAASIVTIGNSYFDEGYIVINGKNLGLSPIDYKLLIAHEIGHFLGLDHTQVNIDNRETDFGNPVFCSTNIPSAYPLMYPFVCRNKETLHADDISSISALYPNASTNNNYGTLQGRFVDATGKAILGANIWAENTTTGEVISIASDYLAQGTGFYKLYLPAGNYTLHANSINPLFNDGSAVGPYAKDISDRSFTCPHPIPEVTFLDSTTGNKAILTVTNGQSQTIDFTIDKTTVLSVCANNDSNNGGSNNLLGSMSHITLLMTASLLLLGRLRSRS